MVSSNSSSESASSSSENERRRRRKTKHSSKKSKDKKSSVKKSKRHCKRKKETSSSDDSSSEEEWVVKDSSKDVSVKSAALAEKPKSKDVKGQAGYVEQDEDWMGAIPTFSRDVKTKGKREIEKEKRSLKSIEKPGQNSLELNPYWKDGGTGLPEDHGETSTSSVQTQVETSVGDGGLSWLKKSYQRAKEQAKEQNKTLEEVAEERWGSLNNFFEMLEKAEAKAKSSGHSSGSSRGHRNRNDERRDSRDRRDDRDRYRNDRRSPRERDYPPRDRHGDARFRDRDDDSRRQRRAAFKRPAGSDSEEETEIRIRSSARSSVSGNQSWRKHTSTVASESKSRSGTLSADCPSPSTQTISHPGIKEVEEEESQGNQEAAEPIVLTDTEMNALNAKLLKAELLGNDDVIVELKKTLAEAAKRREEYIKSGAVDKPKVLTKVVMKSDQRAGGRRLNNKPTETHKDGQRVRYFPDDDRQTLQKMFQKEKLNTAEDENALFSRLAGRKSSKTTDEYDLDDEFADKASSSKKVHKEKEQEVRNILNEEKHYMKTLDECQWCFDGKNLQRNIVIATGEKSFLSVPPFQSLTEGHCLIMPMYHVSCSTQLDEDVWEEMQRFRQSVVKMFLENDQDTVIFETAVFLKGHPHMYWECVPMPKETGELAPIYFKKAIQECETEWAQNKKLVELRGRDIRKAVPQGLPYFSVDFGFDSGFAHVIEDEKSFPRNFAQEIIGGMLELDHHTWRKHKRDDFKVQKQKVMEFLKMWGPHDWTREDTTK